MKIGIVGFGNMGKSLAEGISEKFNKKYIIVSDKDKKKLDIAKKLKFNSAENALLAKSSDIIILAVKPSIVESVIEEIKPFINGKKLLISIAAGVPLKKIEKKIEKKIPVIRVMPNINVKVKAGIIAYCKGKYAKGEKYDRLVEEIFSPVGIILKLPENKFDTITAISGSGPGFIFYIAEILQKICEKKGIKGKRAISLIKTLFYGSGKMLFENDQSPKELKDMVCSPKGTTIAGIEVFEKNNFPILLEKVINKSERRSKQLSKTGVKK